MKKALIIGGAGFVGKHLYQYLKLSTDWEISVTKLSFEDIDYSDGKKYDLDISNFDMVNEVITSLRPDYIFHLAAQSSVYISWEKPGLTIDVNLKGTLNILDAIRKNHINTRILIIGSSEQYGSVESSDLPIKETLILKPENVYAISKQAQENLGLVYAKAYQMDVLFTRSFNHIGTHQNESFVVPSFCKQISEIEKGIKEPVIRVGNLSAKRDFTDVRDIVRAYKIIIESGTSGEIYNVGQGKSIQISKILEMIIGMTAHKITVEIDQTKFRPIDVEDIYADVEKVKQLGWEPTVSIQSSLKDILEYWRNK